MKKISRINLNKCLIGISAIIAFVFLFVTLYVSNLPIMLSSEKFHLQCFEILKDCLSLTKDSVVYDDSLILVNTHYADTLVMEREYVNDNVYDIGYVPVVNKEYLYNFLKSVKDEKYKYILLDVFFDKAVNQIENQKLYRLIASMDRIGIASVPKGRVLADTCLVNKIGRVDYNVSIWESDFVKYRFKIDGQRSLALKMYEDITRDTMSIDGFLARNNAMLSFDNFKANIKNKDWNVESLIDLQCGIDDVDGKYIIIGDFGDIDYNEGDTHNTYLGATPGPIINFCAYDFLLKGHHRISILLIIVLYLVFWLLVYQTLMHSHFIWIYILGYPVFWIVLFFIIYLHYQEVYDVLITSFLFYILKTIIEIFQSRKYIQRCIVRIPEKICYVFTKLTNYMNKGLCRIFFFLFMLAFPYILCVNAQEYHIMKMSYPKRIKIGGVWKTEKNNKFWGGDKIEWCNGRQWFIAKTKEKIYKVTCRGFKNLQGNTMDIYTTKYMGHKGVNDVHYSEKEYYLLGDVDTLMFPSQGRTEHEMKIIGCWYNGNQSIEIPIKKTKDSSHYIISTDIYKDIYPRPEHIKLNIREEKDDWIDNVYTNLHIYYYPQ